MSPSHSPPPDKGRRAWLYGGVAGAATLAGMTLAWWNQPPEAAPDPATQALWQHTFDAPDNARIRLQSFAGKPLLINFWATWCPPCVEELPLLDRFYQDNKHKGWQVLGIAADQLVAVKLFLARTPVLFPVALAGMEGITLSKTLGNLSGGLPFTIVLSASGSILHRKMGRVTAQELLSWSELR